MSTTFDRIKSATEKAIVKLNSEKVSGTTRCSEDTTYTEIEGIYIHDGYISIDLRTTDLVIAYNNSHDPFMEEQLISRLVSVMKEIDSDIVIRPMGGGEKGYWGATAQLKSEKKLNIKKDQVRQNIYKLQTELKEFDASVAKRIRDQKSSRKTCSECGSSVNVSFFKTHKCPVCFKEAYTATDKKKVDNINLKISKLQESLNV